LGAADCASARSASPVIPTNTVAVEVLLLAVGSGVEFEVTLLTLDMVVSAAVPAITFRVIVNVEVPPLAKLAFVQLMGALPFTAGTVQVQPAGTVPIDWNVVLAGIFS
jgi:hypothetical protein